MISERLRGVELVCQDGVDLIREYDSPHTLHYLDPPYLPEVRSSPKVFRYEMAGEDHERLLQTILQCQGHVCISGYDNPLYNQYLRDWHRVEWNLANHSSQTKQKQRRIEVMWINSSIPSSKEAVDRALAECS
jgi:DNA adenine methylase